MDRDRLLGWLQMTLHAAADQLQLSAQLAAYADLGDLPRELVRLADLIEMHADATPLGE